MASALLGPRRVYEWRYFQRELDPVNELIFDEIRRRRAAPDLEQRDDVLSLLVQARHEDGRQMSDEELRDELMTLLAAGHETTATALAWALERLVRHPDKLARLAEGDEDYTDAVIKETLRLRPGVPGGARQPPGEMGIRGTSPPARGSGT